MDRLIIGLTGLIGSGKSAVAQILHEQGAFIIDTDVIAHELTKANSIVLSELTQMLGNDILNADGSLNRVQLRTRVFNNDELRLKLENILHPKILAEVKQQLQSNNAQFVVIVVPLLFKVNNYALLINRSLLVDCPQDILIKRVMQRNNLTKDEVLQIIATQVNIDVQKKLADDIIVNDGSIDELKNKVMRYSSSLTLGLCQNDTRAQE